MTYQLSHLQPYQSYSHLTRENDKYNHSIDAEWPCKIESGPHKKNGKEYFVVSWIGFPSKYNQEIESCNLDTDIINDYLHKKNSVQ